VRAEAAPMGMAVKSKTEAATANSRPITTPTEQVSAHAGYVPSIASEAYGSATVARSLPNSARMVTSASLGGPT
jgi:hypothetical protein